MRQIAHPTREIVASTIYPGLVAFEVVPPLAAAELRALRKALAQTGIPLDSEPEAYVRPWRRAAITEAVDSDLTEAVDSDPTETCYAPSPRSTRGATRA